MGRKHPAADAGKGSLSLTRRKERGLTRGSSKDMCAEKDGPRHNTYVIPISGKRGEGRPEYAPERVNFAKFSYAREGMCPIPAQSLPLGPPCV